MSNKQVLLIESEMSYTQDVDEDGIIRRRKNKKLHTDDDEPSIIYPDGTTYYHKNGKLHRNEDKPAIVSPDGSKQYYKNGEVHRDGDNPAIINSEGYKAYYKNGELHRNGEEPAIITPTGVKKYYIRGVEYTKEQVKKMEEERLKKTRKFFRRWYDETYSDPESKAFQGRMERDYQEYLNFFD